MKGEYMHNYKLETIKEYDNYYDYDILYDNNKIGILQIARNDNIFVRQIHIYDEYKRCGHASHIIDQLLNENDVKLCIATHSQSAMSFWHEYFKNKNVENVRGEIYIIKQKVLT